MSVTSFNEWHEGSVIEPADGTPPSGHGYQTFRGAYGRQGKAAETAYPDRTRYWVETFESVRWPYGRERPMTTVGKRALGLAAALVMGLTACSGGGGGTQQVRVRRTSDNAIITTSSGAEIGFATAAGSVYVVERTAKPLGSYTTTRPTGTADQGMKSLSGTASTLGLPAGSAPSGTVGLRSRANNRYVTAENAGALPLVANRTAIGPWESFDLITG
ncbi:hypothetical protein [Nonomuraea sp. NPDC050643]|uniref:fascin domain-containing protein n=1 Tax=Nonomuraea sp. NPDC050643 TaxID=3155660 RepID=UPI0033CA3D35